MIFVASRGFIIFILNVICLFIVLSAGLWLSKEISSRRSSYNQPLPNQNHANNSAETRYNDYAREQRNDYIDPTLRRDTNESFDYNKNNKNSNFDYENRGYIGDGDNNNQYFTEDLNKKSSENQSSVRRTVEKLKGKF
jgi:FtsZ-interacting cell division protein ZipA